jgi:hypothetical protein
MVHVSIASAVAVTSPPHCGGSGCHLVNAPKDPAHPSPRRAGRTPDPLPPPYVLSDIEGQRAAPSIPDATRLDRGGPCKRRRPRGATSKRVRWNRERVCGCEEVTRLHDAAAVCSCGGSSRPRLSRGPKPHCPTRITVDRSPNSGYTPTILAPSAPMGCSDLSLRPANRGMSKRGT